MRMSPLGMISLLQKEGIVVAPYRDSVGVWTWGAGHTAAAGFDPATMDKAMPSNVDGVVFEALDVFREDVVKYETAVNNAVTVPLTQYQFDALVSWHYNTGAVGRASLIKKLNAGDYTGAATGLMDWRKPKEIIPRRKAEQLLFRKSEYGSLQVPIYGTNGKGKIGKRISVMSRADLLPHFDKPETVETGKGGWIAAIIAIIKGWLK